ncbi:Protein FAM156A/FAM156B [Lemmus lemmus]
MDPLQKWVPISFSMPSRMATVASSQDASAGSPPSSSEKLSLGLSGPSLSHSPGFVVPAPQSEGLLQQQAREKKALWQQYWEKQGFPQRIKFFLKHAGCWHRDHIVLYLLERAVKGSPSSDKAQNQLPCQDHVPNVAVMSGERNVAPNPHSWEMVVQGFSGLTLSLGANRPSPLPEGTGVQLEPEQMLPVEKQQESMRMFQRMLK